MYYLSIILFLFTLFTVLLVLFDIARDVVHDAEYSRFKEARHNHDMLLLNIQTAIEDSRLNINLKQNIKELSCEI